MNNYKEIEHDLKRLDIGDILVDEPMYKHTTYKVGGPAKIFVYPKDVDKLKKLLTYIKEHKLKYKVIGNGSDLLFSDKEYDGIIICLMKYFRDYQINGLTVKAKAGTMMIVLAKVCAKNGLSGFEFMSGIPGTVGGGVFMNAGAYKYDMASVVTGVTILDDNGEIRYLTKEQMNFSYRHSIICDNPQWTILEVEFELWAKDPKEIQEVIDKRKERRMATQPWNQPSAGSVFRNLEAMSAWQYIDKANLRGYEIGGAQVSMKHSNFIVNTGYASSKDIYDLIKLIRQRVYETSNVELITEVELVNWE